MNSCFGLLARAHMADVSARYRAESSQIDWSTLWYLFIPVVLVAIAVGIHKIVNRAPQPLKTADGMLQELCRAHQLDSYCRRTLRRMTDYADLDNPAIVFVSKSQFEKAEQQASKRTHFGRRQQETLGLLKRRLFV